MPATAHQLSYTIPFAGGDGTSAHFGGVLLNYRYQVLSEGPGRPAFSPRFSLILPTGRSADDSDRPGVQVNLPFSKQVGDLLRALECRLHVAARRAARRRRPHGSDFARCSPAA